MNESSINKVLRGLVPKKYFVKEEEAAKNLPAKIRIEAERNGLVVRK